MDVPVPEVSEDRSRLGEDVPGDFVGKLVDLAPNSDQVPLGEPLGDGPVSTGHDEIDARTDDTGRLGDQSVYGRPSCLALCIVEVEFIGKPPSDDPRPDVLQEAGTTDDQRQENHKASEAHPLSLAPSAVRSNQFAPAKPRGRCEASVLRGEEIRQNARNVGDDTGHALFYVGLHLHFGIHRPDVDLQARVERV